MQVPRFPAGSLNIHSGRLPSANTLHFCLRSYWVSFPELMSHRSASHVCATGSSRMGPGQLLWDVVLQVPLSRRRRRPSLYMSGRSLSMDLLPAPLSLLSAISPRHVSNPLIYVCIRSAGINWLLVCFSRPVSSRSLLMDLLLDHISLLPDYHPLLNDNILLGSASHSGHLTSFPTDSYCLLSGMYL